VSPHLITAGGIPGPGTVSCPAKKRFLDDNISDDNISDDYIRDDNITDDNISDHCISDDSELPREEECISDD
jgi:hypothetical protein